MHDEIIHLIVIGIILTLTVLAFWKICVVDTRNEQKKFVDMVVSGQASMFVCGGVVYGDARVISKNYISAIPASTEPNGTRRVILDVRDISRPFDTQEATAELFSDDREEELISQEEAVSEKAV